MTAIPEATSVFAEPSDLPFHAPDFTAITDDQYQAAIEEGIAIRLAEITAIADNPAPPTFSNTLVAMERTGRVFSRASQAFNQKVSANINPTLAEAEIALAPQIAAMESDIYFNTKLFGRIKMIYDQRAAMTVTVEDAILLETVYREFVHRGALLDAEAQSELRQINERISELKPLISRNMTDAQNEAAVLVDSREELVGLTDNQISAAAANAAQKGHAGKFLLTLTNTTSQPLLAQLDNRDIRERIYRASVTRNIAGEFATIEAARETIQLRNRIAQLFGEPTYADWQMYDRMVEEPARAIGFMADMVPALRATQEREAAALNERIAADGHNFTVQPWDWPYYAEKIRQERYSLDNEVIKQYFVVDRVLEDGAFFMANKLYGLTFEKRDDIPVYHPDVSVYTVFDHDGSELALFYFDPFARNSKRGGAWMDAFVGQSDLLGLRPVISNTQNIIPPADGVPALATFDDVNTLFHEFGHALHAILSDATYPSLAGTSTTRDWVEFPSQFHENFAVLPEVLENYARHYETGETIPAELVSAIQRASKFNQGYDFGEIIAASLLDMKWHTMPTDGAPEDVLAFEATALEQLGLRTDLVPPRYRTPYFRHIFEHEYQAGYYAYTWTEMLHHDAYSWVEENGGMTRAMGDHIRDTFLSRGHTRSYGEMFRDFTGRDPQVEPLLEARGLLSSQDNMPH